MSDHDFDTNGPNEEELRDLLRSMPRTQAPDDLEPQLMRRIDGMRRRRGLFGVFHVAARPEWIGGVLSAAGAAAVVAAAWLHVDTGTVPRIPSGSDGAPERVTALPLPAPRTSPAPASVEMYVPTPQSVTVDRPAPTASASKHVAAPARRAVAPATLPARRRATIEQRASVAPSHLPSIDTVAAARLQNGSPASAYPTSSEAGIDPRTPETVPPIVPAPTHDGAPTGVDTGPRSR